MRFSMNVVTLGLLLLSLNLCAHAHLHTAERAEAEAGDGAGETLKGRASNGAMISETVYDRIAASAKGQVQKKQIDSKGSTIIVDNTNGLATIVNGKDDIDELKQKHDHERTTKKDNEEKFKQETEDQKKRDIQLRQAKRERKEEQHKKDAQLSADQVVSDAKDRQKRAEQKAKVRKSKEQTNKYFVDFTGLCTVASTCPPGWDNKGLAGIIVHKRHEDSNSFKKGEEFDSDWRWMHPYVCCAANQMSQINDLFVFSRKCPKGSKNQGMAGIIMVKKNYDKNPFHNGGNYNDYWRWSHPYACQTPNSKIIKTTGTCLFAASCPQNWSDAGYGGILIHRNYYAKQPFHKGGEYNDSWQWAHPRVCCL